MNKLLILLLLVIALVIGSLLFSSGDDEGLAVAPGTTQQVQAPDVGTLTDAERDTYETTVRTISVQMTQLQDQIAVQAKAQDRLASQQITPEQREKKFAQMIDQRLSGGLSSISDSLSEKFQGIQDQIKTGSGIPAGLGFDNLTSGAIPQINDNQIRTRNQTVSVDNSGDIITIMPVTTIGFADKRAKDRQQKLTIDGKLIDEEEELKKINQSKKRKAPDVPVFTIPQNATLMTNTTMTALVGIVPTRGSVLDPFRFKVITGDTNIATNALYLPEGIKNIVWSGIATGNREMSCVRGELHSVTFTFEDGTIITRNSQADQGKNKLGGNLLGYISDRRGNPCLPGKLITNASDYLRDRMIASGFAAAAEGVAVTQQTTVISDEGNVQQFFDGDTGDFIAAKTLQGGLNELTGYLRERQANAIDLVFVAGGLDLVVHVETQINIDYQPDGRKLHHASTTQNKLASFNLD